MIWSNIWRNQERKNAEIENFFGTLSLASWGLGNCDSDIAVSSIHHGSQYRLNFSDGFWVGGLEVCELCLTRILWISITQFDNRKRAWTRWVCRPPLPPTSPTSSEIMLLMDRLLPPPVTGKAMNHNGLQWCLTAGGSATWSSLPRTSAELNLAFGNGLVSSITPLQNMEPRPVVPPQKKAAGEEVSLIIIMLRPLLSVLFLEKSPEIG